MKQFFKSKFTTVLILIATIVLAGVAIFTAYRLYSLRQQAVAPNAPSSAPAAQEVSSKACTALTFSLATGTATATATATATGTATTTATATSTATATATATGTPNACGGTCGTNANCREGFYCYQGYCKNPDCPTDADCSCNQTASPTGTLRAAASPTAEPALPDAGTSLPTIIGISAGTVLLIVSLLLAL